MADKSYNELRQELDGILEDLQSEELDIDLAFKKYEVGAKLIAELEAKLKAAENKIIKLQ